MSTSDFRMVVGLHFAARTAPTFTKPIGNSAAAKNGLRYERKVGRELQRHTDALRFDRLEHNPWFQFKDTFGAGQCSPDFLLHIPGEIIIVEVKLTWVEVAAHKLNDLYNPVISEALGRPCYPLIICRNLAPGAPPAEHTLGAALKSSYRLLHWPEMRQIQWK